MIQINVFSQKKTLLCLVKTTTNKTQFPVVFVCLSHLIFNNNAVVFDPSTPL